jgi:hypothetical protein
MSETLEEQIKRKTAKAYKIMEVPNTISQEELNIIYNNKKKYYGKNATRIASLDVAYDLIKKDRGFVSPSSAASAAASASASASAASASAASNAPAGSSAAASAAQAAALKEEMEHVMRLLRGEAPPQSKKQEQTSNFYSAFKETAKVRSSATASGANKQENRQNQSSNKTKKEKEAFALFETTEEKLRESNTEIAKKEITKIFRKISQQFHPDKWAAKPNNNNKKTAKEKFSKYSAAYELIQEVMGWRDVFKPEKGGTRKKRKN